MAKIDLDAARRARAEQRKEKHQLRFRGKDYKLPAEFPVAAAVAATERDPRNMLYGLLGKAQYEKFWKDATADPDTALSEADMEDLVTHLEAIYLGTAEDEEDGSGESEASGDS